jgi:hypothetical protein
VETESIVGVRAGEMPRTATPIRLFAELNATGVTSPLSAFIGVDSGDSTRYAL